MRYQGLAYRAHEPKWAWDALSGEGARRYGGRFNRKGVPALYLSLTPLTAIEEVQPPGRPMQPLVLCAYDIDVEPVFDATDKQECRDSGIEQLELSCPHWEMEMLSGLIPSSQLLADRLFSAGFAGMRFRSFATGAGPNDLNLVLWNWGPRRPAKVLLVDEEKRLSRNRT